MRLLPTTLKDALDALEKNTMFPEVLGEDLVKAFISAKREQWKDYCKHVSQWEMQTADEY